MKEAQSFESSFKKIKTGLQTVKSNYANMRKRFNAYSTASDDDIDSLLAISHKLSNIMERLMILKAHSISMKDDYENEFDHMIDTCKKILSRVEKDLSNTTMINI